MPGTDSVVGALVAEVRSGRESAVARALSLVTDESSEGEELCRELFKHAGSAVKIGLCGPPGCGKSTLVGKLAAHYRRAEASGKVGILAIDPSSPISGGAFLGDRLRIQDQAHDPGIFIRSLSSRGRVGGLSHAIFGAIHVLEAAGFSRILIETVGTGQDEVDIAGTADTVVYVTTPGLGDEIQAMKAGVMEIADVFAVNKSDLGGADKAVSDLRRALALGRAAHTQGPASVWDEPVVAVSALSGECIPELAQAVDSHEKRLKRNGEGDLRRKRQFMAETVLYMSRRLTRRAQNRVTDRDLESLLRHETDPVSLCEKLIDNDRRSP